MMFWWYIPIALVLFLVMLFVPALWVLLIPYCVFWLTDSAPEKGGRRIQWIRCVNVLALVCVGGWVSVCAYVRAPELFLSLDNMFAANGRRRRARDVGREVFATVCCIGGCPFSPPSPLQGVHWHCQQAFRSSTSHSLSLHSVLWPRKRASPLNCSPHSLCLQAGSRGLSPLSLFPPHREQRPR